VLLLCRRHRSLVSGQARDSTRDGAANAVLDALAIIIQLALGLLSLALAVLLDALLLERLVADCIADKLLGRADGLVPLALSAVRVVFGDAVGCGSEGASSGGGVGQVATGLSVESLVIGGLLRSGLAKA
jgi:hypothetical protein